MSANLEAKKVVVEEITQKIKDSKSVVLMHYTGLTVVQDNEIRAEFRKNDVECKVYKNTLVRKAFNDLGITNFDADLNGPSAVAFAKDETSAARVVFDSAKKFSEKVVIKSGYVDGACVDVASVEKLALIPSREVLYAKLAGSLSQIIGGLAVALKAVADKQVEA